MFKLELLDNRYPALHGLRAIGIYLIVNHHVIGMMSARKIELPLSLRWVAHATWLAMDLLFVLSGFLIGSLLFAKVKTLTGTSLKRFFIRRAFRIFPLYYVCLILVSKLPVIKIGYPRHQGILWQEWVYLSNYPFDFNYVMYWSWSLSVEEHFYIVAPFLVLFLFKLKEHRHRLLMLGTIWFGSFLAKALTLKKGYGEYDIDFFLREIWSPTHIRMDTLIAGLIGAYLHCAFPEKLRSFFQRKKINAFTFLFIAASLALLANQFSTLFFVPKEQFYWAIGSLLVGTATSPLFVLLMLWGVYGGGSFHSLLSHRVFLYLASLSYGTYLMHIPVIDQIIIPFILRPYFDPAYPAFLITSFGFVICAIITTAVAYLLHLLVEKPMLKFRNFLAP